MGSTLEVTHEAHCQSLQQMLDGSGITLLAETIYLGTGKSHHGVEFGDIEIDGEKTSVAIKNYEDPGSAMREASAYQVASTRGIPTLEVIEVGCSDESSMLMTKMIKQLYAYDNLDLPKSLSSNKQAYENVSKAFVNISSTLASMHLKGFYHGDAVLKNFGVNPSTNETVAYDFESAIYTEEPPTFGQVIRLLESEGHENLQIVDLVHLWRFAVSPYECDSPFLADEDDTVILEQFDKLVLAPYISFIEDYSEELFGDKLPKTIVEGFRHKTVKHLIESMSLRV